MVGTTCAGDVGSQGAPVVGGAWRPETGRQHVGCGRLNAQPPAASIERPLTGAAFGRCRPEAGFGRTELTAG